MPNQPALKRELGVRDLALFSIVCITSARWLPIAGHAGPGSIALWILAAILFMVPLTIAVAALVAKYPGAGGLYLWTREDFGPWQGFLAFWSYWLSCAFLFPSAALLYIRVGFSMFGRTAARAGDDRAYLVSATILLVWIALGSNIVGMKVGKWTENIGALATGGVAFLLVATAWMVWTRRGPATALHILPKWDWGTVNFWAAIAYAMSGMECPGMMAAEMRDPERTMRHAGWLATPLVAAFYVATTISFLVILPPERISEFNGFADVGNSAGALLHAPWLSPLIALLVILGGAGLVGGIGTAASRMPFAAGVDRLLPAAFGKVHPRWGTPYISILTLGAFATLLLVVFQLGDSMRAAYDEMVSLMVITGFLPYIYIFASAWKVGRRVSVLSGMGMTLLAIFCSVVPPSDVSNRWLFEAKLAAATIVVVGSAWLVYRANKKAVRYAPVG